MIGAFKFNFLIISLMLSLVRSSQWTISSTLNSLDKRMLFLNQSSNPVILSTEGGTATNKRLCVPQGCNKSQIKIVLLVERIIFSILLPTTRSSIPDVLGQPRISKSAICSFEALEIPTEIL